MFWRFVGSVRGERESFGLDKTTWEATSEVLQVCIDLNFDASLVLLLQCCFDVEIYDPCSFVAVFDLVQFIKLIVILTVCPLQAYANGWPWTEVNQLT